MAENFCYNQNGINHILEQFGDAISNKQYKNRIPYERPYNPQCDPPEYENGSYFLSYDLMYAGRPYAGFAVGDVTALACYKYVYDESKAYLKERLKYEV